MRVDPADGIGTVVMTNATAFDVRRLLDDIDSQFLVRLAAAVATDERH
jgi:hypothetical protein